MKKFKIVCDTFCLVAWIIVLTNEVYDVIAGGGFNPVVGISTLVLVISHYIFKLLED